MKDSKRISALRVKSKLKDSLFQGMTNAYIRNSDRGKYGSAVKSLSSPVSSNSMTSSYIHNSDKGSLNGWQRFNNTIDESKTIKTYESDACPNGESNIHISDKYSLNGWGRFTLDESKSIMTYESKPCPYGDWKIPGDQLVDKYVAFTGLNPTQSKDFESTTRTSKKSQSTSPRDQQSVSRDYSSDCSSLTDMASRRQMDGGSSDSERFHDSLNSLDKTSHKRWKDYVTPSNSTEGTSESNDDDSLRSRVALLSSRDQLALFDIIEEMEMTSNSADEYSIDEDEADADESCATDCVNLIHWIFNHHISFCPASRERRLRHVYYD